MRVQVVMHVARKLHSLGLLHANIDIRFLMVCMLCTLNAVEKKDKEPAQQVTGQEDFPVLLK